MPAPTHPNTAPARTAKRRKAVERTKETGTLQDVQKKMWSAIIRLEQIAQREGADDAGVIKATHCLIQACGQYSKLLEVGEYEARIAALEKEQPLDAGGGAMSQIPRL